MTTPRDPKKEPSSRPQATPPRQWVTRREAVDAYFDGELPRRSPLVRDAIRENPADLQRLEQTERILDQLSAPMQTPDLANSILDDVHMLRPFQPPSPPLWRTIAGWSAIAAAIVIAVGGYVVLQSFAPKKSAAPSVAANDVVAPSAAPVRSVFDQPNGAAPRTATRERGGLEMGIVASDSQPRRWDTQLARTGLDEVPLASLDERRSTSLASTLSRELGLDMKASTTSAEANLTYRREPFPVPPSAWIRRPVKAPSLMDLSKLGDPRASLWFAPSAQQPLKTK